MNISDLASGDVSTVEVVAGAVVDFEVAVESRAEASLQFPTTAKSMLRVGARAWSVVVLKNEPAKRSSSSRPEPPARRVGRVGSPKGTKSETVLLRGPRIPQRVTTGLTRPPTSGLTINWSSRCGRSSVASCRLARSQISNTMSQ